MKITDILENHKTTLSFEVFPPKTSDKYESVEKATSEIAKMRPDFMSVTYGAGGGTSKFTVNIASNLKNSYGVTPLAHLTCVSSDKETVRSRLEELSAAGPIRNKKMVERADLVIAFWDGISKGTKSLIKYAQISKKEVIKIDI